MEVLMEVRTMLKWTHGSTDSGYYVEVDSWKYG